MQIANSIVRHPRRTALVLSIISFMLFSSGTPWFNVGYGSSDEFLTVGHTGGLAEQPGYALYVSVLHLVMHLPVPGTTPAFRAHVVSGASAAVALYFMTLTLFLFTAPLTRTKKRDTWIRVVAIGTAITAAATARLYWLYAQIAEKYMFGAPFVAAIVYLGTSLKYGKIRPVVGLFQIMFLYGLLLSHQQSMLVFLPYIVYVLSPVIKHDRSRKIGIAAAAVITGFALPLLITFIVASHPPSVSWKTDATVAGLINLVSGRNAAPMTLNQIIPAVLNFFTTLGASFSWWIIVPLVIAITALRDRKKAYFLDMSLPFLLVGICLGAYFGWPQDLMSQATVVPYYIPGLITVTPLICFGIFELIRRLSNSMKIIGAGTVFFNRAVAVFAVLLPVTCAILIQPSVTLRSFNLVSSLYSSILNQVEPNSIVTCYSDSSCYALLYEQTVNSKRPDVDIVPAQSLLVTDRLNTKKLNHFTYGRNPFNLFDIVTWNLDKRPVYAVDISQYYFTMFGINNGFMKYIPVGYFGKLSRSLPNTIAPYDAALSRRYAETATPSFDLMRRSLIKSLSETHMTNAYIWLRIGNRDIARTELDTAVNLAYRLTGLEKKVALANRNQIEQTSSSTMFSLGSHVIGAKDLLSLLPDLYKSNKNSQAYIVALGAATVEPENTDAHLELARIYTKMKDPDFTRIEYRNVLVLDPSNQEAKTALSKLSLQ